MTLLAPTALGLLASSGYLDLAGTSADGQSTTAVAAAVMQYETGLGIGPRGSALLRDAGLYSSAGDREWDHLLESAVEPFTGWRDLGRRGGDRPVDIARGAVAAWVSHHRRNLGISHTQLCQEVARGAAADPHLLRSQLEDLENGRSWTPRMPPAIEALGLDRSIVMRFGDAVGGVARALFEGPGTGTTPPHHARPSATRARVMENWVARLGELPGEQAVQERSVARIDLGTSIRQQPAVGPLAERESSINTMRADRDQGPASEGQGTADARHHPTLAELRRAAGLSSSDVAETLGLSSPARVLQWETGRHPLALLYLAPLAELYGVDQATIEEARELDERTSSDGQDASGPRGPTPLGELRAAAGLSQTQVAQALGLRWSARVSRWETGREPLPARLFVPLAELYGVQEDAIRGSVGQVATELGELGNFEAMGDVRTSAVELSTRLRSALLRLGIDRFGELRGMTIAEFRELRNVGSRTAEELVGLLDGSRQVTWSREEAGSGSGQPVPEREAAGDVGYIRAPWEAGRPEAHGEHDTTGDGTAELRALVRDLGEVAAWWTANHGQAKLPELFGVEPDGDMPPSVIAAFDRLQEATLRELAEPERLAAHDPVARFEAAVLGFEDQVREILVRRAGQDPETLESIGTSHQITRERIRQLEARGQRAVDELLDSDQDVTDRLPELRAMLHPIATKELLDEVIVAAFPGIQACDTGTADLFRSEISRRVGDLRDWHEGWLAPRWLLPALKAARRGRYDGQPLQSLRQRLGHTDRSSVPLTVMLDLLGLWEVDGTLRRQPVGLPARAVVALEMEEAPLAFDVLLDRLGPEVNHRSLRNALMGEERIVRTDRDVFALAEWGLETYEPISDMIARHLTAHGGSSTMDAIIGDLTSRFSVAASSVRAYVRSDRFVELPDGTFRERTEADPVDEQLRPLRAHAGCVRINGRWAYRVRVDEQLLSGYSAPVPTSFAAHLGLRPLESRLLASQLGTDVSVTRKGLNPMLGRLRPVAQQLGLGPGSLLFVVGPDGPGRPLSFIGYEADRMDEASPRERAGLQLALEPSFGIGDVLRALDLDGEPPEAAVALLGARGEDELADALGTDRSEVEEGPTTDAVARLLGF